jgi:hypothetical protein
MDGWMMEYELRPFNGRLSIRVKIVTQALMEWGIYLLVVQRGNWGLE